MIRDIFQSASLRRTAYLLLLTISASFTAVGLVRVFDSFVFPIIFQQPITQSISPPIAVPSDPSSLISIAYGWSPYAASAAWVAFAIAMWKGEIRKLWQIRGYDYDVFRVFTRMRGSNTRLRILRNLQTPRNRLQLARELEMHWESIDNHISVLIRYGLVNEAISYGTAKYLIITEKGKEMIGLVQNSG
jgi:DNA-binding MarR family transcriptional regulator